ncbi:DUF6538 domain-containing protein [uncultured Jannaschia sp.]|uniref:DUF6538 domain-containing protein n=1 Tax=uncultured Jannaschia sp. TaxID=293347 RepID=UPI00341CD8FF
MGYAVGYTPPSHPVHRRAADPYLLRRGRIYYFRKRLPKVISGNCCRTFLCLSLRTPLLSEAMSRSARVFAAYQRTETRVMTGLESATSHPKPFSPS